MATQTVHWGCMGVPLECGYTDSALGLYGSTIRVWLHRGCTGVPNTDKTIRVWLHRQCIGKGLCGSTDKTTGNASKLGMGGGLYVIFTSRKNNDTLTLNTLLFNN